MSEKERGTERESVFQLARTEKEKKSSGNLQKSKNQKETRTWKNKWISKVKGGFLFNFSNRVSPKKPGQPDSIMFGLVGQSGQSG